MHEAHADEICRRIRDAVHDAVILDPPVLDTILTGFLADGHVLLEDVPGTGKTMTARTLANALGLSFSRIQCTPDLLPSDILGSDVFNEHTRDFEFRPGPVFSNVLLADELNRASPKTQSALLEAMAEGQVTVGTETHHLPRPFFVIATQNPIESVGTFELPEAQLDRFMVQTRLGYPDEADELDLLDRRVERGGRLVDIEPVCTDDDIDRLRRAVEAVTVADPVRRYLVRLTRATRDAELIGVGISPRGTERLFEAARAWALLHGRGFVTPDDVRDIAPAVLSHRIQLTPDAEIDGHDVASVITAVVQDIPVPKLEAV